MLFSLKRNIEIADPNGSSVLLYNISDGAEENPTLAEGAVETPDDLTVVFHLNAADTTFLKLLSTATTSIVDEETFPADSLMADDAIIGSGPYKLSQYKPGEQAVFEANESYDGPRTPEAAQVFVQYFSDPAPLKTAIETGDVDIAWRTLSPTDINEPRRGRQGRGRPWRGLRVPLLGLAARERRRQGRRRSARRPPRLIDRDAITANAYDGTTAPSYSIVPPGFGGQKNSFEEKYGAPDADKAKALLEAAGVKTPVKHHAGLHADALRPQRRGRGQRVRRPAQPERRSSRSSSPPPSGRSTRPSTRRAPTTSSSSAGTRTSWTRTTT